jgi:hypothetical protein
MHHERKALFGAIRLLTHIHRREPDPAISIRHAYAKPHAYAHTDRDAETDCIANCHAITDRDANRDCESDCHAG